MYDIGGYGSSRPEGHVAYNPSLERLQYLRFLRTAHDEEGFRQARADALVAPEDEVERLLFEAEMLANYDVIED